MKMKNLIAASVAALLVSATAAKAADVVHYQEPEFKPAFSWTGLYGGGTIGWGWGNSKNKLRDPYNHIRTKTKVKPDGFMGGFYAGYNFQFSDAIILGMDTDFLFTDLGDKKLAKGMVNKASLSVRERWNGATRARIGYAWDRFLPYFAAGVSYGDVKVGSKNDSGSGRFQAKNRVGWNVGAGIDYAMTDHIILRGEYRFTDFGTKKSMIGKLSSDKSDWDQNDFRLGVAYKF